MTKIFTTKNVDRLRVIQMYLSGEYTREMAALNLKVTERQVTRIIRKYIEYGPESVIHGNTGRQAQNKHPDDFCNTIISLYKGKYGKNGVKLNFRHFKEKLEDEGIYIPYSSLRRILLEGGIKPPETRITKTVHPPRPRRIFAGELLQMDASIHNWLHGDSHLYALHGAIDDATGIITGLWLERAENMRGYQMVLYQTMKQYGKPKYLYTDKKNVFESANKKSVKSKINSPRFKAMLIRLGINVISTSNPRAKGRIERVWRTLQSRLLNELYLRKITTIEEANAFIEGYIPVFNEAFASRIDPSRNSFREVPADYNYNQNLALCKEVKVHGGCYLALHNHYFVIKNYSNNVHDKQMALPYIQLYQFLDDSLHVLSHGEWYDLEDIGPRSAHGSLLSNERSAIAKRSSMNSPWRQFNPKFTNRDRAKWDDENLRRIDYA